MKMDLSEPERLALAYIIDRERQEERNLRRRAILADLVARLAATDKRLTLSPEERQDVAYRARREIETNRNLAAPQLRPLTTAFKKLAPGDSAPKPPPERPLAMRRRRR